jgi:osmotically-inducible protein OsmY
MNEETIGDLVDDASITAQVKLAGVVTLSGRAANQAEKDLVSKLTRGINGVKSVNNNMTVKA